MRMFETWLCWLNFHRPQRVQFHSVFNAFNYYYYCCYCCCVQFVSSRLFQAPCVHFVTNYCPRRKTKGVRAKSYVKWKVNAIIFNNNNNHRMFIRNEWDWDETCARTSPWTLTSSEPNCIVENMSARQRETQNQINSALTSHHCNKYIHIVNRSYTVRNERSRTQHRLKEHRQKRRLWEMAGYKILNWICRAQWMWIVDGCRVNVAVRSTHIWRRQINSIKIQESHEWRKQKYEI